MTSFPTSTPKLSVKDSFDEDEVSDDIDDEVFIRDGRNGFKVDDERGAKRPLMAPRRKSIKSTQLHSDVCKGPPCRIFCAPCCYGILALAVLLGVIVLVVYLVNSYPSSLNDIAPFWKLPRTDVEYLPCTTLEVKDVWAKSFPKLTTESAFRLVDVNKDGVLDVIFGYGTGADGYNVPEWVCAVYFSSLEDATGTGLCLGGVLALDGENGNVLWQRPMRHEVFGLDCSADLTSDSINDCLATGRGGVFSAVNSHDGSVIWEFGEYSRFWRQKREVHSIFLAQYVEDMDGDGTQDVLAVESGGASDGVGTKSQGEEGQAWSRIWLVSGTGGSVLGDAPCPGGAGQSLTPPRVLMDSDGGSSLMVSISSLSGHGSLYIINLHDLLGAGQQGGRKRRKKKKNAPKARLLFRDPSRGILAPPALADLNGDGTEDIIVATCNSSVLVYDGVTLNILWSQSLPSHSESFSSPAVAYYNEDNTPDIIIRFHTGPGFPMFYYSQVAILDGKNGDLLHGSPFVAGAGPRLGSPLSISLHGPPGHDMFIYWSTDCRGHMGSTDQYRFPNGTGVPEQLRADICRLRYGNNSTQTGQLFAIGRYMSPPGVSLYNSEERLSLEHNSSMDILAEVQTFLDAHPDYFDVSSDGALSELAMDGGDAQDEAIDDGGTSSQGEEENTKDIAYPNGLHSVRKHGWGRGNSRTRVYPWLNNLRKKRDSSKSKKDEGLLRLLSTGTLAPSLSPRDKRNEPPKYIDLIFATHWIPMENNASGKNQEQEDKAGRKALLEDIFIPMGQMTVYRVRLHCQCSLSKGKDPNIFECPSFAPFSRQGWPSHMGARGNGYFRPRWS